MACVIAAPGMQRDQGAAEAIARRARENLVYFKIPGYVAFTDELPLTPSEKPKRAEIKSLALAWLEQGDCHDVRHLKKRLIEGAA
jgi:acyl-coenzyme A synthetase/AMP-(fatty) acid ligase